MCGRLCARAAALVSVVGEEGRRGDGREGGMAQVETQGFPGAQYGYPPVKKDEDGNEIDCTWTN